MGRDLRGGPWARRSPRTERSERCATRPVTRTARRYAHLLSTQAGERTEARSAAVSHSHPWAVRTECWSQHVFGQVRSECLPSLSYFPLLLPSTHPFNMKLTAALISAALIAITAVAQDDGNSSVSAAALTAVDADYIDLDLEAGG